MFLQSLDLTTALRPSLLPDEALLLVQDCVGLYEGKYKIPNLQNGHAYLTTHRACYVDNDEPRKSSVAVELKSVDKYEFYAGFLKSSAKVTLYPKEVKVPSFANAQALGASPSRSSNASPNHRGASPYAAPGTSTPRSSKATWVCVICSFSNPVPQSFDPATANANTPLPPCQACGIKPTFPHVLKAAISAASGRRESPIPNAAPVQPLLDSQYATYPSNHHDDAANPTLPTPLDSRFQCPRCTFLNHPSLLACELCGASLLSAKSQAPDSSHPGIDRPESPGPSLDNDATKTLSDEPESIKFSFRAGGEKIFHERLKGAMTQRKWLLQSAPPIPAPKNDDRARPSTEHGRSVGIAGLERRGLELRQKNEAVIGNAFSDLDALMASAKEIIALAESFAAQSSDSTDASTLIAESARSLDMVTTKDMAGDTSLYLSEMSRNLAEYLTDDSKDILRKEGGIMPLVDLWSVYNRARGGVDLVSPAEFEKAARLWEKLKLPVRLRHFKNGLLVVQQADRTDDKTIAQLLAWLQELHSPPSSDEIAEVGRDTDIFGRGITAQDAAQHFGWSVGVAREELEMAEENGALVRDGEGFGALTYWENWIVDLKERDGVVGKAEQGFGEDGEEDIVNKLKAAGLM